MRKDDTATLKVTDLTLVVTLLISGFSLKSMDSSNPSRVIFEFENSADLEKTIDKFWKGEIVVEPKKFNYTLRELKDRIRNEIEAKRN